MGLGYTKTATRDWVGDGLVLVTEAVREKKGAAVPITHTNAKGKTYYLHQGTTKTGKPTYHFSMQSEGTLAEIIPAGFEIYENPQCSGVLTPHSSQDYYR